MSKAEITRLNILKQAFGLIYTRGYQATSIDDIIATTKMTKGAFFYHFKTKDEMGLAMIREVMIPGMDEALIMPLLKGDDPVKEIYSMMQGLLMENPLFEVRYGCPAINLIEEMAPLQPLFHEVLSGLTTKWQEAMQKSITRGKAAGRIRNEVNARQVASFIAAGYGGIRNMGKLYGVACYTTYLKELKNYLQQLS
jgi:AcrR family transcriptional regulator